MPHRVLVLQVRDHRGARDQERVCFRNVVPSELGTVEYFDLVGDESFGWSVVDPVDVLMIGGAGEHTVTERYAFTEPLAEVVRRWVGEGRPFFGSCWGHHFLGWALGGTVITDGATEEVGTFEIELTEAGRVDPLLVGVPPRFNAQLGHHDRIDRLPEGGVELARSERCRHQMLRIAELPVYSTQFHPELDHVDLCTRLDMYADSYLPDDHAALLASLQPSPEACGLLERFLADLP